MALSACGLGSKSNELLLQPQQIHFDERGPLLHPWGTTGVVNPALGGEGVGEVRYSSSDDSIASVNPVSGELTLHRVGRAVITAVKAADFRFDEASASYTLWVTRKNRDLKFEFPGNHTVVISQGTFANPVIDPPKLTVVYKTNNPSVAQVDDRGLVTLNSVGNAVLTAYVAGDFWYAPAEQYYSLQVTRLAQQIQFDNPGPLAIRLGTAGVANLASGGAGNGSISYFSSNEAVAKVDPISGVLTLISEGVCEITAVKPADALYAEAVAHYQLRVEAKDPQIVFERSGDLHAFVGETVINPAYSNYGNKVVSYQSSNRAVATVNASTGEVKVLAAGTAKITASQLHLLASYNLNVAPTANVRAMAWSGVDDTVFEFDNDTVIASAQPLGMVMRYGDVCLPSQTPPCADADSTLLTEQNLQLFNLQLDWSERAQLTYGERNSAVFESNALLPPMDGSTVVSFAGKLWRLSEMASPGLWVSDDGTGWKKQEVRTDEARALFSRVQGRLLSFGGKLWMLGGATLLA
ncbi:MAG: Ig-like domain-containing protein, partial [Gammaproteobacteria bacterium]|nr:Ig-like domain-containing protein [Gammaproteobacteria bacterium]